MLVLAHAEGVAQYVWRHVKGRPTGVRRVPGRRRLGNGERGGRGERKWPFCCETNKRENEGSMNLTSLACYETRFHPSDLSLIRFLHGAVRAVAREPPGTTRGATALTRAVWDRSMALLAMRHNGS